MCESEKEKEGERKRETQRKREKGSVLTGKFHNP